MASENLSDRTRILLDRAEAELGVSPNDIIHRTWNFEQNLKRIHGREHLNEKSPHKQNRDNYDEQLGEIHIYRSKNNPKALYTLNKGNLEEITNDAVDNILKYERERNETDKIYLEPSDKREISYDGTVFFHNILGVYKNVNHSSLIIPTNSQDPSELEEMATNLAGNDLSIDRIFTEPYELRENGLKLGKTTFQEENSPERTTVILAPSYLIGEVNQNRFAFRENKYRIPEQVSHEKDDPTKRPKVLLPEHVVDGNGRISSTPAGFEAGEVAAMYSR